MEQDIADAESELKPRKKRGASITSLKDGSSGIVLHSVALFILSSLLTSVLLELLPLDSGYLESVSLWPTESVAETAAPASAAPTFAIYGKSATEEHLVHVFNVLQRFGYQRITLPANGGVGDDTWDLLWAHDYPFLQMPQRMRNLQPHQLVNHLPGCGFITNKVDLSTTRLPFLPRAFKLPAQRDEFLRYAHANPAALFVEKHNEHRHIAIRPPGAVNLNSNDSFVQEYVPNPFLVDGHKFDIGVYVLITAVDPLRVYIYGGDVLFRYCPVRYHPFDANNTDKYVVGDDYLPTWELPSLRKYYERFGGSMRGAFDTYVRDQSLDPSVIWPQVEDIIRRTVLAKEADIVGILRAGAYKTPRNFFDLMRFDLIIDASLRVHLMEANMSPNLSSAHFKPNSLLYEQILYSALNLIGIGTPLRRPLLKESSDDVKDMVTADKNLATNLRLCAENHCDNSCNLEVCSLCLPCLRGTEYEILERAHREHLHRTDMKRIFPKPILNPENFDLDTEVQNMTKRNAWLTRWFYGKCQYDRSWCY